MPCDLHTPKSGECYVDSLAVLPASRGKGVGTKLLAWAESIARSRSATRMTLGVISGNPAKRLYLRTGYTDDNEDCVDVACTCVFITVFFGRPYGCCHRAWGGTMMTKVLGNKGGEGGEMERS